MYSTYYNTKLGINLHHSAFEYSIKLILLLMIL